MSPETLALISTAIASLSGSGSAWMWYDKKRRDKVLDQLAKDLSALSKEQIEHSNKFITEEQTRKLLQEYIAKLEQSWAETNQDIKEMKLAQQELIMDLRVMNALKDYEKEIKNK